MKTIIKVRWFIINDKDEVFLLKNSVGWKYILPGWKQEKKETITDTFYREILEETGIKPVIEKFLWFNEYINKKWEITIQFTFKIKNYSDFININKTNCSHWHEWDEWWFFSIKYLDENNYDYPENIVKMIEISKDEKIFWDLI